MAKHLHIVGGRDEVPLLTITVDGQEMTDVISYKMEGSRGRDTLTLVMEIMDAYELEFDYEGGRYTPIKAVRGGRGSLLERLKRLLKRFPSCIQWSLSRFYPKYLYRLARPLEHEPHSETRDPDKSYQ